MKVLIACEESQEVCKAFREKGHEAYSADIKECSGGHPEWHINGDVIPLLNGDCTLHLQNGETKEIKGSWDMIIAHPPCTYLTNCGTRWYSLRVTDAETVAKRWEDRAKAAVFFMYFVGAKCEKIAIENPVGFMSTSYRKPDQYVNPWMWAEKVGDENYHAKKTGLWLKGLPLLKSNGIFQNFDCSYYGKWGSGKNKTWEDSYSRDAGVRSKTFSGIAKAMAEQWG